MLKVFAKSRLGNCFLKAIGRKMALEYPNIIHAMASVYDRGGGAFEMKAVGISQLIRASGLGPGVWYFMLNEPIDPDERIVIASAVGAIPYVMNEIAGSGGADPNTYVGIQTTNADTAAPGDVAFSLAVMKFPSEISFVNPVVGLSP